MGVTNSAGGVLSSNAVLTVNVTPQITLKPVSIKVLSGQSNALVAAASGQPAPAFV